MENSMAEERGKDRFTYERPEFVHVKFSIEKGPEKDRARVMMVIDSSKSGLAMLITQKDSDLLEILKKGDKIRDMRFFGIGARIKEDGTVKHMTKIKEGKFKGAYSLGVEAPDRKFMK
jgi:hypothetical protein